MFRGDEKVKFLVSSAEETRALGAGIGQAVAQQALIALIGPLGAGKTCLVQGVGEGLAVREQIVSPTFTMLNEYDSGRLPLYHLDLYRLKDDPATKAALGGESLDLLRAELDEFIHDPGVVVIEWAEQIGSFLPADLLLIEIEYGSEADERRVSIAAGGPMSAQLLKDVNSRVIYR